jgi:short-subunit dehydrogenase
MDMARTALITGASSGLGAEYARQLAARGVNLVLVGRNREALDDVGAGARERGVEVEILVADLLVPRQRVKVERRLQDPQRPVDLLVNNAGIGLKLSFETIPVDDEVDHLRLHAEVPLRLTHAVLPGMIARGSGRVINIASVAGFLPRGTYGAAKAWLISFSRWANVRYGGNGISVTAVCPGFVHTNFHERLGLPPGEEGIADWMWLDALYVVSESLRDVARGRSVSIPSARYKVLVALSRVLPDRVVVALGGRGR